MTMNRRRMGKCPSRPLHRRVLRPKAVWLLWLLPLAGLVVIAWYVMRGGLDRSGTFEEVTDIVVEPFDGK